MKRTESKATAPVSDARLRLAGMIAARDAITPNLKRLEAQRDRLAIVQSPDGSATAELAILAAKEAAEMTAWSVTGDGPVPVSNVAKKAALQKTLAASNAAAENARLASAGILAEIDAESRRYASMAGPIRVATVEVLIEECEPKILAFERINAEASASVMQIQQLGLMITEAAHAAAEGEEKGLLFSLNTRFFERLDKIDARRAPSNAVADAQRDAWAALQIALDGDANATLSDSDGENHLTAHEPDIGSIIIKRNAAIAARKGL
jgi:predicted DNA-binding ribbon-helix-helix protein